MGTPVVAACVGGVPDMVADGETGLLFQAGDSTALASKIARVLTDDALAVSLAVQARRTAHERHSPVRIADALLGAYEDILKSSNAF